MKETGLTERILHGVMILDAIVVFFVGLISALAEGTMMLAAPVVNLFAAMIESIVGIFIPGFKLGRLEKRASEGRSRFFRVSSLLATLALLGVIAWIFVLPGILNRKVTLVAEDGNTLPFASVVILTNKEERFERTDRSGKVKLPRFQTVALTLKDPRYVQKTWPHSEIENTLVAERSLLGSGLDKLGDRLLKPPLPQILGK